MPTNNPRVNVVLEKPLYTMLHELADNDGISMSMLVRNMVRDAIELREDRALGDLAEGRESNFDRSDALTHDDIWG